MGCGGTVHLIGLCWGLMYIAWRPGVHLTMFELNQVHIPV